MTLISEDISVRVRDTHTHDGSVISTQCYFREYSWQSRLQIYGNFRTNIVYD